MLRAALLAAMVLAGGPALAGAECSDGAVTARYTEPTGRYPHGVLGDALEWGALKVECAGGQIEAALPETLVFEDVAPRLIDLDGDGRSELIVVESHRDRGARLAIWSAGPEGLARVTATPFIGTRFRWLAPVGAADMDGDGAVEIAYVDRPHLAKVLRVWRYADGTLTQVAAAEGVTNHRIGERDIAGGMRHCAGQPEAVVASADWTRVLAVRLEGGQLQARNIGPHDGRASFEAAMACR